MRSEVEPQGDCDSAFSRVREVFAHSLANGDELGASVCVWHQGRKVVDLWGGFCDRARQLPWQEDTLTTVFSTTKGMVAFCFLLLADRGRFDYDDKVAAHWPEFAAAGKADISIRSLLNHRAGLTVIDSPFSVKDCAERWEYVVNLAAAQAPTWPPDSAQGYHGVTHGIYAAALFARIAGETLGAFLEREVHQRLGAEVYIGLPAALEARVSEIHPVDRGTFFTRMLPTILFGRGLNARVYRQVLFGRETAKAFANPTDLGAKDIRSFNTRQVHALELPWGNGISNARGLARMYAALAAGGTLDGVRVVEPATIAALGPAQSWTKCDRVLRKEQGWSGGFVKEAPGMFSPTAEPFGHPGAGGALGWCDPGQQLAIGYVPNKLSHHVRSPRARALTAAVYRSIH